MRVALGLVQQCCRSATTSFKRGLGANQSRKLATAAEYQFGQPLHETHPHLLKAGERTVHQSSIPWPTD